MWSEGDHLCYHVVMSSKDMSIKAYFEDKEDEGVHSSCYVVKENKNTDPQVRTSETRGNEDNSHSYVAKAQKQRKRREDSRLCLSVT